MVRFLLLVSIALGVPASLQAQDWEFGIFAGGSNYYGDLAPFTPQMLKETKPAIGGLVRYNLSERIALRGNLTYGQISGDDANFNSNYKNNLRNLSFRSDILEVSFIGEFHLMKFDPSDRDKQTTIYGLAGFGIFNFNPQAEFEDKWVDLQPLGTEGQGTSAFPDREKYSLTQFSFPLGAGVKHALSRNWTIGAEVGFRLTTTDYLDDVSKTYAPRDVLVSRYGEISYRLSNRTWETLEEPRDYDSDTPRGDPNSNLNDLYIFGGLTLTYTLVDNTCPGF